MFHPNEANFNLPKMFLFRNQTKIKTIMLRISLLVAIIRPPKKIFKKIPEQNTLSLRR